nr:hypothetical protein [Tanacetum cinerariifolium]
MQDPYKLSNIITPGQPTTTKSQEVLERIVVETFSNISPENKAHYDAEKESIHSLLTGIGYENYSTVDACNTTHDMWITIERLVSFRNQRTVTVAGARETVGIQEVLPVESGFDAEPIEKVQYNAKYNVFSNERLHPEQPKSINNTCVVEKVNSNVILDSLDMCDNDNQADQNAKECDDEHVVLANIITNLKLDTDEKNNFKSN